MFCAQRIWEAFHIFHRPATKRRQVKKMVMGRSPQHPMNLLPNVSSTNLLVVLGDRGINARVVPARHSEATAMEIFMAGDVMDSDCSRRRTMSVLLVGGDGGSKQMVDGLRVCRRWLSTSYVVQGSTSTCCESSNRNREKARRRAFWVSWLSNGVCSVVRAVAH